MASIKLSPKHGVNPSIKLCFFCGQPTNDLLLMGRIGDGRKNEDIKAPMYSIADYEPCENCKNNMMKGITLIGVSESPLQSDQKPISIQNNTHLYPTGSWCVVSENFIQNNITSEIADSILKARKAFIEENIVQHIINMANNKESECDG